MFRTIIVPVDGSPFGELALPLALGIACKTGGSVRTVTVITPLPTSHPSQEADLLEAERLALAGDEAARYQADLKERVVLSGCDVPVSCHVETGPVVDSLDTHARECDADLLVITTHGRGPLRRAWLGSVADGLLRRTPCPILVVRPADGEKPTLEARELRRILVTLDGSSESREVLPLAKEVAEAFDGNLVLLRVVPPHLPLTSPFTAHASPDLGGLESEKEAARISLQKEAELLRADGIAAETRVVTGAHPAEGILDQAEEVGADLVAMATHGRGGVARLLLGSVADKVIRGGTVPVLLHRAG